VIYEFASKKMFNDSLTVYDKFNIQRVLSSIMNVGTNIENN
jgi:hypothetical protein